MKTDPCYPSSFFFKPCVLLISFLITICVSNDMQGQSLFEMAVKLDSLYSTLKKDSASSKPFFEELEKIYKLDDAISPANIKLDFADNRYMSEKVNNAFRVLVKLDDQIKDRIQELEDQRLVLFAEAISEAQESCKPKEPEAGGRQLSLFGEEEPLPEEEVQPCNIEKEIRKLIRDTTLDNLTVLRKISNNDDLVRTLTLIEGEIFKIEFEISEQKAGSESIFQLSAEAGDGLYLNSPTALATNQLPPIILQQQGGGSLQSSIIDGASKWIAERMREELSIAFFDRFEYWVEGKNIKILFPSTFSALKSSLTTDYALMVQIFKTAFKKDLEQLPFNLGVFLEEELAYRDTFKNIEQKILLATTDIYKIKREIETNEKLYAYLSRQLSNTQKEINFELNGKGENKASEDYYANYNMTEGVLSSVENERQSLLDKLDAAQQYLAKSDELVQESFKVLKYVLFTLKAIDILAEGEHPTSLLSYLNENIDELFPQSGNVKPALLVMDVISRSMISINQEKNTVWLKGRDLARLKYSAQLRDFYFGLIYQEIKQTIRRERIRLEEDQYNIMKEEIFDNELGLEAETIVAEAVYMADYYLYEQKEGYNLRLRKIEDFLSHDEVNYLLSEEERTQFRMEAGPLYEEAMQLVNYQTGDRIEISSRFANMMDRLLSWPEIEAMSEGDEVFFPIDERVLQETPIYAVDSLFELIEHDEQMTIDLIPKLNITQINDVVELSKKMLTKTLDERLPFENPSKKEFYDAAIDLMVLEFKDEYQYYRLSFLGDSIHKTATKFFVRSAKRDSAAMINSAIEENMYVQKINIHLQRLGNYEKFIDTLLLRNKRNFGDIVNGFLQFSNRMDNIHAEFKRLKEEGNANFGTQEFIYLMKSSLDALNQIYELALPGDHSTLNTVRGLTINLLDAYSAVLEKDYDAIVMNIIPVADSLLELSFQQKVKELKLKAAVNDTLGRSVIVHKILDNKIDLNNKSKKELKKELTKEQKKELRKAFKKPLVGPEKNEWGLKLDTLLEEKENKIRKMHEIFKYGAFLAAVVESKDADEIKRAIQAVALPAGSYSIKRRTFRNISLNSYPGLTGGLELASNANNNSWAPNFGFTAPIGLAVSWGYKSKIDGFKYFTKPAYRRRVERSPRIEENTILSGHAGTVFLPLIDLGAVVLFRFDNDEDPLPEDIGFQQIFSPGIMYAHGLPDLPISIMGGIQVSPQLRKIDEEKANSFRFNVSVVVDLPLANFHTRTRYR